MDFKNSRRMSKHLIMKRRRKKNPWISSLKKMKRNKRRNLVFCDLLSRIVIYNCKVLCTYYKVFYPFLVLYFGVVLPIHNYIRFFVLFLYLLHYYSIVPKGFLKCLLLIKLRKKYPYHCFAMAVYQLLLMALVSTFLCTWKLGPEEVIVTAVESTPSRDDFLKSVHIHTHEEGN